MISKGLVVFLGKYSIRRGTLSLRMSISYVVIFVTTSLIVLSIFYHRISTVTMTKIDNELIEEFNDFKALTEDGNRDRIIAKFDRECTDEVNNNEFYRLLSYDGRVLRSFGPMAGNVPVMQVELSKFNVRSDYKIETVKMPGQVFSVRCLYGAVTPTILFNMGLSLEDNYAYLHIFRNLIFLLMIPLFLAAAFICWFIFPLLFFSLSKGKLLTYILPCFVPFALMLAIGISRRRDLKIVSDFKTGTLSAIGFYSILAIALLVLQLTDFSFLKPYVLKGDSWMVTLSMLICLLIMGIAIKVSGMRKKIILYAVAPMIFMLSANFAYPDMVLRKQAPGAFLLQNADRVHPDTILVSGLEPVRAICWFYKRNDVYLMGGAGELSYGLKYKDAENRLLDEESLNALIKQNPGRVVLVAEADHFKKWRQQLPVPQFIDQNGEYVFSTY